VQTPSLKGVRIYDYQDNKTKAKAQVFLKYVMG
jgi:hypothetical protein